VGFKLPWAGVTAAPGVKKERLLPPKSSNFAGDS
jgi:hypothetical protein